MEMHPFEFPIERGTIRQFARATLEEDPSFYDDPTPLAPLIFTRCMSQWSDQWMTHYLSLGVDPARILHGGQEFEYLVEVRAGDVLTVNAKVIDVKRKP